MAEKREKEKLPELSTYITGSDSKLRQLYYPHPANHHEEDADEDDDVGADEDDADDDGHEEDADEDDDVDADFDFFT